MKRNSLLITFTLYILFSANGLAYSATNILSTQPQPRIGLKVGNTAPEFELPLPNGQMLSLKSLRGKIVLIDFWASWCQKCRAKPHLLVSLYEEFNNKEYNNASGFTILSVSMDRSKESWLKAIEEDKLIWNTHVCDFKMQKSSPFILYNIRYIPNMFLLDGNGVIIAKNIGYNDLKEKLTSLLKK